ncbi:LuxR C-terminal-related transcriptional regulator [Ideonella sp. DXS29W]|uniref:LuxR C-terminal-related transcriptional regulator n=1 Tax=Ideonella lacteola TaxID=2984193 RepID=A0ABU9BZM5_9BURK
MQQQLFLDVSQAQDVATFERRLLTFAGALDFGLVNAWLVSEAPGAPTQIQYVGNRTEAFVKATSDPRLMKRDPVLHRLHTESLPFTYSLSTYIDSGNGDLADVLDAHGYRNGVTVALHLPGNKHFVLGLAREDNLPTEDHNLTHLLASLQLVAVHAQIAAQRVMASVDPISLPADPAVDLPHAFPKLTPREIEVLTWTMQGKSGTVVAEFLGISHAAVKFHVANAMKKLNAPSKHVAVLRARDLGLL